MGFFRYCFRLKSCMLQFTLNDTTHWEKNISRLCATGEKLKNI